MRLMNALLVVLLAVTNGLTQDRPTITAQPNTSLSVRTASLKPIPTLRSCNSIFRRRKRPLAKLTTALPKPLSKSGKFLGPIVSSLS
jgi:hypothetical protein